MPADQPGPTDEEGTLDEPTPREALRVAIDVGSGSVEVAVAGELDESTAPTLVRQVGAVVEPGRDVVVDLGGLAFCGSAGLSALILIERQVAQADGALRVVRPTPFVVELLEMAGLDRLLPSSET